MDRKDPCAGVLHVMTQGTAHRSERQLVPGNVFRAEEGRLAAFRPGIEGRAGDLAQIKEMDLLGLRNIDDRVERTQFDLRAGLFLGFAHGALRSGLAQFHEAGGEGPFAQSRFDGAPAQQDAVAENRHHAHDIAGILIVNGAALVADVAHAIVFGWYPARELRSAHGAELLRPWRGEVEGRRLRGHGEILTKSRSYWACGSLQ